MFMAFASALVGVLQTELQEAENTDILENWYFLSDARVIKSNFKWQQRVLSEAARRQKPVADYFSANSLNLLNYTSLYSSLGISEKV